MWTRVPGLEGHVFSSLHGTTQPFITAHWQTFKATGSILSLATMLAVIIRQHRTLELLYGGYCQLFHGPSPVEPCEDEAALIAILQNRPAFIHHGTVSREQLIASYGESFRVDLLPPDFEWARWESIWREDEQLIIGEYGEDSRIAHVTPTSCGLHLLPAGPRCATHPLNREVWRVRRVPGDNRRQQQVPRPLVRG